MSQNNQEILRSETRTSAEAFKESIANRLLGVKPRRAEQVEMGKPMAQEFWANKLKAVIVEPGVINFDELLANLQTELKTLELTQEEIDEIHWFASKAAEVMTAEQPIEAETYFPEGNQFQEWAERHPKLRKVLSLFITLIVAGVIPFARVAPVSSVKAATIVPTATATAEATKKPVVLPTVTATLEPTPTLEPSPTPESTQLIIVETREVLTSSNIRSGPGTNFPIVGSLPEGSTVTVKVDEGEWLQISYIDPKTGKEVGVDGNDGRFIFEDLTGEPEFKRVEVQRPETTTTSPVAAGVEVTATKPITQTEDIPGTVNTEAAGGTVEEKNLLVEAQLVNSEISSIKVGENIPVGLDKTGFPVAEYKNGAWVNSEILSAAEFQNNVDIKGKERFEELPKETAYAREDGTFAVIKLDEAIHNQAKFSVTDLGVYVSQPLAEGRVMVMVWEELEFRADWKIPQFEGERVTVSISSAYNDVHPNREVILKGEKQYLFAIHNGTVEEALASEKRKTTYLNNSDGVAWLQKFGVIEQNEQPILLTPELNSSVKLDKLITTFWEMLSKQVTEGKIVFPKLEQEVDTSKKVEITIWRFPDDEEGKLGWFQDQVSPLPQRYYQVAEDGHLVIHMTLDRTGSYNMGATIEGAFAEILRTEFDIEPEWVDVKKPMYTPLTRCILSYVALDQQNNLFLLPVYADLGEEIGKTWNKDQ